MKGTSDTQAGAGAVGLRDDDDGVRCCQGMGYAPGPEAEEAAVELIRGLMDH